MDNINQPITELYLALMPALQNAGILPNKISSGKEFQEEKILSKQHSLTDVNKDNSDSWKSYMVIGHSCFWSGTLISTTIQKF
eukprot:9551986-Ditylum_brightwellii.AAC.1